MHGLGPCSRRKIFQHRSVDGTHIVDSCLGRNRQVRTGLRELSPSSHRAETNSWRCLAVFVLLGPRPWGVSPLAGPVRPPSTRALSLAQRRALTRTSPRTEGPRRTRIHRHRTRLHRTRLATLSTWMRAMWTQLSSRAPVVVVAQVLIT